MGILNSFAKGLTTVNLAFMQFRSDTAFKLAFNAQIIYLEQYLNTVYPNPGTYPNNIHILDGANIIYFYVWNSIEQQNAVTFHNSTETFDPLALKNFAEQTGSFATSYVIKVPTYCQTAVDYIGLNFNETLFKKRVNFYNLAGKTYSIQYF